MRSALLLSIVLFLINPVFGQRNYSTDSKRAVKYYEEAELLLRQRKFTEAIAKLNEALEKDNNFTEAHLRLAFSYELLRNKRGQQYHLEQVVRIDPNSARYKNVYYSLGRIYFDQGQYAKSEAVLNKLTSMGIDNARMKTDVIKLLENIDFALEGMKKPLDINPEPLSEILNSFALQYFPVLTADENTIIYTAREGVSVVDDENIMISSKNASGNWEKPYSISPNINSQFNEGTCTISADGRTLIFTNCEGRQSLGSCDLFISFKTGEEWSVPKNLGPAVNSRSWDSQPAISADGRTLFFISDRAHGLGKRDIWMSKKDREGKWTDAVNLGPGINTSDDEVSPFIHVNGSTLFFASRGYPGFGGFDLYKSELKNNKWSSPINLGYPVNTFEDQVSLFVSTDGRNGYYSYEGYDKNGVKKSELYGFEFPSGGILINKSIYLTGNVYDSETKLPLEANIELYNLGSDEPISIFSSDPVSGEYFSIINEETKIALYVEREGYLFESNFFDVKGESGNSIRRDIYLQPIKKGNSVRLNNIFFEFNSAEITEESGTELNKIVRFLNLNPNTKITIAGHTDNEGTEAYNLALSQKRAEAVYTYLIKQGINPDNLTYIGYGESKPMVKNDSEENKRINRRIEFLIKE